MQLLNFFLSALTPRDRQAVTSGMVEISLASAEGLYEVGDKIDYVYFPSSACISVVTVFTDGKAVETSTIGRESVVGMLDAITMQPSHSRVFAQIGGSAMRSPAATFRNAVAASPDLLRLVLLHARATALQAEQGVACNASHEVNSRLARWLLMTQDRVGASTFPLTQDYMAVMAGVQRSTVSTLAASLKRSGVIDYSRGQMVILDRDALRREACECYSVVGEQFEHLRETAEQAA